MCRRVECGECGHPSYAGCGKHIEQVLGDVPPEDRCRCKEERAERPAGNATEQAPMLGRFRKLFR